MRTKLLVFLASVLVPCLTPTSGHAQTAATGALTGTISDTSGAVVPGATVTVTRNETGEARLVVSESDGSFRLPLLDPGTYMINVQKTGFKTATQSNVQVLVTETNVVNISLEPGAIQQTVSVSASEQMVQTESSALGRVVDEQTVENLPLVTRNYTQILSLSPGVIAPVNNATDLGRGNGGLSGIVGGFGNDASIHANGNRSTDNNFQMNGLQVNDISGSAGGSGGVPIPNPDTIQEFKVQTGQYDASYGRNAGANVGLITKSGTNGFHGNVFEFFRNTDLNANDFFANEAGASRGVLDQNQFGGTFGGPILKDKLSFFGSYQGTRQENGIAFGCSSTMVLPTPSNGAEGVLGNDRSALAIAQLFNGQRGLFQNIDGGVGPAIDASAPSGNGTANPYNINPVALALLQMKLPDGSYLIPSAASASGLTVLRNPCSFNEDQYLGDVDWIHSARSTFFARYFIADSKQTITFPNASYNNGFGATLGSPSLQPERFQALALGNTYTLTANLVNEVRVGFHRTVVATQQENPFSFSSIGASVSSFYNNFPSIYISGCCQIGGGAPSTSIQGSYDANDMLAWTHGKHNIRVGGGVTRSYLDQRDFRLNGIEIYPTWPDFLLGLNAFQTGTIFTPGPPFGNILVTIDFLGDPDRDERAWDAYGYFQDDIKLSRRFTVNVGLRYERIGELGDTRGRNGNFDPALANPNPPASGTLAGYTVPSNFEGAVPAGVTTTDNNLGIPGYGQNAWEPRVGFAWQPLPNSDRFVVRGGYGIYYTRPVGAAVLETTSSAPFGDFRLCEEACALGATAQNPFPPAPSLSSFPLFQPYSPSTNETVLELGQDFRPPRIQQYSFGVQTTLAKNYLLEVGYVGSHGTDLIRQLGLNQALSASPQNPVRGQTDNTIDNIPERLPYLGFSSDASGINEIQAAGFSWYNALEASVTKRFSSGFQFLASYTWSKELDTDAADPEWGSAGGTSTLGNQSPAPGTRYGPGNFNRSQRFVASYLYEFPTPSGAGWKNRILGGWSVAGVTTIQSGQYLTISGENASNVFGITNDRIEMAPGCTYSQLATPGSVKNRLTNYFNGNCIDRQNLSLPLDVVNNTNVPVWPVIGADGIGTNFGNSGIGIVTGPGQANYDLSLQKVTPIRESMNLVFRTEFFNAFNHPQFSNPDVDSADSTFGQILSTSVNPRIIQFALKLNF